MVTGRWRGARVAVKILEHGGNNKKESMQVAREAAVGAALSHPNSETHASLILPDSASKRWPDTTISAALG